MFILLFLGSCLDGGSFEKTIEIDADSDEITDTDDNCPSEINPDQLDSDEDGYGDICDVCPTDPMDDDGFKQELIISRGEGDAIGIFNAVAIDSNNKLHMSYEAANGELLYTTNDTGEWTTIIVDSTPPAQGKYSSIAVDSNNKGHIVYFEWTEYEQVYNEVTMQMDNVPRGNLKYATNANGEGEILTLDYDAGLTPRIFVDNNDNVHIVHSALHLYLDEAETILNRSFLDLKYTTNKSGSWETVNIESTVVKGTDASITVDSNGYVHISARNEEGALDDASNGGLRYITNAQGEWSWYDVDTGSHLGNDTDITIDANNNVHISYLDKNAGLKYATNESGSWESSLIDDSTNVGWNTSIAVDPNNKVYISYVDSGDGCEVVGNGDLKFATNVNDSWNILTVDTDNAGYTTGLVIDENNNPHIAYYAYDITSETGELRHAWTTCLMLD